VAFRIRSSLGRLRASGRQYAEQVRLAGALLAEAKARHRRRRNEWEEYLERYCDLGWRMAEYYIDFYEYFDEIEPHLDAMFAPGATFSIKRAVDDVRAARRQAALPGPAGTAGGEPGGQRRSPRSARPTAEPAPPARSPVPGPGPAPPPQADPTDRPDCRLARVEGPGRARDGEGPRTMSVEVGRVGPADEPAPGTAPDPEVAAPPAVWPGVTNPDDAGALDEFRARLRAALGVFPRLHRGFGDDGARVRALWAASGPLREQVGELLGAFSPRALAGCPPCRGEGVVSGRPCGHCAGAGFVLVD
jgi:hypothetical protein